MVKKAKKTDEKAAREMTGSERRMRENLKRHDLGDDLLELVEKHGGYTRYVTRDHLGKEKLMAIRFGPKNNPTVRLEIQDFRNYEDPLDREERMRKTNRIKHERELSSLNKTIDEAVSVALKKQRAKLMEEFGVKPDPDAERVAVPMGERWSKKGLTLALIQAIKATNGMSGASVDREGSNKIILEKDDQTFKITVSMPRKK